MDREYELFYIVRPDLEEELVRGTMDELSASLVEHGGEVGKSSLWGRRRLSYNIATFSDGYYVLNEIKYPAEKVRDLERQLELDERVIRHMITLKQVYYLPGGEDRRGRTKGKPRDKAADGDTPQDKAVADSVGEEEPQSAAGEAVSEEAVPAPQGLEPEAGQTSAEDTPAEEAPEEADPSGAEAEEE